MVTPLGNIFKNLAEGITTTLNNQEIQKQKAIAQQAAMQQYAQQAQMQQQAELNRQIQLTDLKSQLDTQREKELAEFKAPGLIKTNKNTGDEEILRQPGPGGGYERIYISTPSTTTKNVKKKLTPLQTSALNLTLQYGKELKDYVSQNPEVISPGVAGASAQFLGKMTGSNKAAGMVNPKQGEYMSKVDRLLKGVNNLSGVTRFSADLLKKIKGGLDPFKEKKEDILANIDQVVNNAAMSLGENEPASAEEMKSFVSGAAVPVKSKYAHLKLGE